MNKIARFNEHLECPSMDGIFFPDGSVYILDVKVNWRPEIFYTVQVIEKSSIEALESVENIFWSSCAIHANCIDKKRSIEVFCGEASYGSDGFVAVIDLQSRDLIWLAFFRCSDPFDGIKIIEEEIHVKSTNNCTWQFRIDNPLDIKVICVKRKY